MDGQRFDDLTRSLAAVGTSRRAVIKAITGGAAGGLLALIGRDRAGADNLCKPANQPQSKCNKDAQCCAGLVCERGQCQSGCRIGGVFYAPGSVNPANQCLACRPDVTTTAWTTRVGESCDDANACTSNDVCDATGTCAGTLILPSITCPDDVTSSTAVGTCGATAAFTVPEGTCADTVSCTHASGSSFGLGTTTVTCTATNAAGSSQCSFAVTVEDGQDPSPQCPAPITVAAEPGATSAIVSFAATATDNCAGVQIACNPPSGSVFPIGDTSVTCTATDGSGETANCGFTVAVTCTPVCSGKACGDPDGCGGRCGNGSCPDPDPDLGPCKVSTCNSTTYTCETTNAPQFTDCSDMCTQGATCDGSGNCTGGSPTQCPTQTVDPCRSQTATGCDPDTGCIYPVKCESECQFCDPNDGMCKPDNDRQYTPCGDVETRLCDNGVCKSPCDAACEDWCVEVVPAGQSRSFDFRCCPDHARQANGLCCWKNNTFGTVALDSNGAEVCTIPAMVCSDGLACNAECCETSPTNPKGVCPSDSQYCVNNVLVPADGSCTTDAECVALQGAGAVCSGLDYTFDETGAHPVPNSGGCCPGGYYYTVEISDHPEGHEHFCCSPGSLPGGGDGPGCCGFREDHQCLNCSCSGGFIRRCC